MGRELTLQRGTTRVVFGAGASLRIREELETLGAKRVLVIVTPRRQGEGQELLARLGPLGAGVAALAKEHVPIEVVDRARQQLAGADVVLAFGGGSTIGLAKALARTERVRVAALPTTYSGSEMTPIFGITEAKEKKTGRDERVRPVLVVYDPKLTHALSRAVTMTSLWNAMAHAVEALWARSIDRAAALAAEESVRLAVRSLERLALRLDDEEAREEALEAAYLAGAVFADAGSGLHHKTCHLLGGMFGLPHAATHAALLPHVVRFHRDAAPDAMRALGRALHALDPPAALDRLAKTTEVAVGLQTFGMPRDGIDRIADSLLAMPAFHPRPLERQALCTMLTAAWSGPTASSPSAPLRAPATLKTLAGFGSTLQSEALEGALPREQNAPRRAPYGLYPELLNGTPFTVRNAENSRVWMYRIRPAFSHGVQSVLPPGRFAAECTEAQPNRTRWKPPPIPEANTRVDFLDGLLTLGGAGDPTSVGWAVHLYAANADMADRCFSDADGDLLIVPQQGTLDCRTELGWLRVTPGQVLLVPRAIKLSIGLPDGAARGWVLEVFGRRLRLPERGLIGSNGLADARHFQAPTASFEDRACPDGFQLVTKLAGQLFAATQAHSPFDVVAWHGNHAPFSYDLSLFSPMGSVKFDHPDPSILTVLTAPLDDHGRAIADFVVFPGRWEVTEHSFRPPFMHRNAASEINMVVRTPAPEHGYEPGCTFLSPLLTSHGVTTATYAAIAAMPDDRPDPPVRIPDASLWVMFESALHFKTTAWAQETPLVDASFLSLFEGARSHFDPKRR